MMYLLSIVLANILITFHLCLWKDIVYYTELLQIFGDICLKATPLLCFSWGRPQPIYTNCSVCLEMSATHTRTRTKAAIKRSGLTPGTRLGTLWLSSWGIFIFTWLALAKLGSSVSLLNPNIRSKSLLQLLQGQSADSSLRLYPLEM